jgi:DNA repair protein RadC
MQGEVIAILAELITRRLKEALALMDVRVLDHFIIGDGLCFSFSEQGLT